MKQNLWRQELVHDMFSSLSRQMEHTGSGEDGLRGGDILAALGALSSCSSTFFLGLSPSSAVSIADMGGGVGAVGSAPGVGGYVNDIFIGVNEGSYRTFLTAVSRIE